MSTIDAYVSLELLVYIYIIMNVHVCVVSSFVIDVAICKRNYGYLRQHNLLCRYSCKKKRGYATTLGNVKGMSIGLCNRG